MTQAFRLVPFGGVVLSGDGAPPSTLGVAGNLYLDTSNGRLYGPKTNAGWPSTYIELKPDGDAIVVGAISPGSAEPSPKRKGDIYSFTSDGFCSWLGHTVKSGELALWDGTSWVAAKGARLRAVVSPSTSAPANPGPGDFWIFNDTGSYSWEGGSVEVTKGSVAFYQAGWHLNRSAPEWPLFNANAGANPSTGVTGYRGKVATLVPGTLHTTWVPDWPATAGTPSTGRRTVAMHDGSQWVTLQPLLPEAGEGHGGWISLATQSETNTGSNDTKAITPLKLRSYAPSTSLATDETRLARIYRKDVTLNSGTAGNVITHNLNNAAPLVMCYEVASGKTSLVIVDVEVVSANSVKVFTSVSFNAIVVVVG